MCVKLANRITHRDNKRVQSMAHLVRCVELSEHHSMSSSLTQVPHPELCSLEVRRVDHKLLQKKNRQKLWNEGETSSCLSHHAAAANTGSNSSSNTNYGWPPPSITKPANMLSQHLPKSPAPPHHYCAVYVLTFHRSISISFSILWHFLRKIILRWSGCFHDYLSENSDSGFRSNPLCRCTKRSNPSSFG